MRRSCANLWPENQIAAESAKQMTAAAQNSCGDDERGSRSRKPNVRDEEIHVVRVAAFKTNSATNIRASSRRRRSDLPLAHHR